MPGSADTSRVEQDAGFDPDTAIAVVGLSGRFPGAADIAHYWRNLCDGVESIVDLDRAELSANGIPDSLLDSEAYVRRAALLDDVDCFDAEFFGYTPSAARSLDPQHRLFLECAWNALEDGACDPARFDGSIGVFGACSSSGYLFNILSHQNDSGLIQHGMSTELIALSLQNDKDFLATRVSYHFDLRGPSFVAQTACSSSLVAVHLACQSLRSGECDAALAGGVSLRVPQAVGYRHDAGSIVSAVGRCRPFDIRADGTVFGSGVGVIMLRRLSDALAAGAPIRAVIRGSAVNNDGSGKINYAAPNPEGQTLVVAEACAMAGIDPADIGYVEAHGTGTPLGDPIEIESLTRVLSMARGARGEPCVIGSVKSNIGHLEAASGIAGLIKAVLAVEAGTIPATVGFTRANPRSRMDTSLVRVSGATEQWPGTGPRIAGTSSFGVGGTNAHVVVQAYSGGLDARAVPDTDVCPVLLLSARSADALARRCADLARYLEDNVDVDLRSVARTLEVGRQPMAVRAAVPAPSRARAIDLLDTAARKPSPTATDADGPRTVPADKPTIAFLYSGQGQQYSGMAADLYASVPLFRDRYDRCARLFGRLLDVDLIASGPGAGISTASADDRVLRTDHAQPLLFTIGYALTELLAEYAVVPDVVAGHSIGEYAAAVAAGVWDLPTAAEVVATRARIMQDAPRGAMLAVAASVEAIEDLDDVAVAAINGPTSCVLAGSTTAMAAARDELATRKIRYRSVRTPFGFHSPLMDESVRQFADALSGMSSEPPRIPLLSNRTGTVTTAEQAGDPAHWAAHIGTTVRFRDNLDHLLADPERILVELGPGPSLVALARRHPRWGGGHRGMAMVRTANRSANDHEVLLTGLAELWSAGVPVDWSRHHDTGSSVVALPGYPFRRDRHWIAARGVPGDRVSGAAAGAGAADGDSARTVLRNGIAPTGSDPQAPPGADIHRSCGPGVPTTEEAIAETIVQVWEQQLGIEDLDRHANIFELGADSLLAVSMAAAAGARGVAISPRDIFEYQSVAELSGIVAERIARVDLTRAAPTDLAPVPPNVLQMLTAAPHSHHRWVVPMAVRLGEGATTDAAGDSGEVVRAVLWAILDRHDALRVRLEQVDGVWCQRILPTADALRVTGRDVDPDVDEPTAVAAAFGELDSQRRPGDPPLSALHLRGFRDGSTILVAVVHHSAIDDTSRSILAIDLMTAFGQVSRGGRPELDPVPVSWQEWSLRCGQLVAHPAVLQQIGYWRDRPPSVRLATDMGTSAASDGEPDDPPQAVHRTLPDRVPTGHPLDQLVLTTLARVVAGVTGAGSLDVDIESNGRDALRTELDLRSTVGWFTAIHPISIPCDDRPPASMAATVGATLRAVPHAGIGYGLLRFGLPAAAGAPLQRQSEILVAYLGDIPDTPGSPVDPLTMTLRTRPGLAYPIELRVFRHLGTIHLQWWFDTRRIGPDIRAALADRFSDEFGAVIEAIIDPVGSFDLLDLPKDGIDDLVAELRAGRAAALAPNPVQGGRQRETRR